MRCDPETSVGGADVTELDRLLFTLSLDSEWDSSELEPVLAVAKMSFPRSTMARGGGDGFLVTLTAQRGEVICGEV